MLRSTSTLHKLCFNQGWGQVQLVEYSNTSSTRNQVQVQVQVLCIFTNQVLKYIKYWHTKYKYNYNYKYKYECEHRLAYIYGKYQGGNSLEIPPCPMITPVQYP